VVYPLAGGVASIIKVKEKKLNIDISCDFFGNRQHLQYDFVICVRIFHILATLFRILLRRMKKQQAAPQKTTKKKK